MAKTKLLAVVRLLIPVLGLSSIFFYAKTPDQFHAKAVLQCQQNSSETTNLSETQQQAETQNPDLFVHCGGLF